MPTGSERLYLKKVLHPVYLAGKLERHLSRMIKTSINSVTKLKTCFAELRTGDGLQCAMTGVRIHSFRPFASQLLLFSIFTNES